MNATNARTVRVSTIKLGASFGVEGQIKALNGRVIWSGPSRPHGCDASAERDARAEAAERGWVVAN